MYIFYGRGSGISTLGWAAARPGKTGLCFKFSVTQSGTRLGVLFFHLSDYAFYAGRLHCRSATVYCFVCVSRARV